MPFCTHCGHSLTLGTSFCTQCGTDTTPSFRGRSSSDSASASVGRIWLRARTGYIAFVVLLSILTAGFAVYLISNRVNPAGHVVIYTNPSDGRIATATTRSDGKVM